MHKHGCHLEADVSDQLKLMSSTMVSLVLGAGPFLSLAVNLAWPHNDHPVWEQVKEQANDAILNEKIARLTGY